MLSDEVKDVLDAPAEAVAAPADDADDTFLDGEPTEVRDAEERVALAASRGVSRLAEGEEESCVEGAFDLEAWRRRSA